MRCTTKKGYTLVDILLSLFFLSLCFLFTLSHYETADYGHYRFCGAYLLAHSRSYLEKVPEALGEYGITFNRDGNVNEGRTVSFKGRNVIVHLSNGYLFYD